LRVLNFQAAERAAVPSNRDLAFEWDTESFEAFEVDLLASSNIDVLCSRFTREGVAMEDRNAVRVADVCEYKAIGRYGAFDELPGGIVFF
jgi:hypothetical protein